jgi:heptosyltransferase III
LYVVDRLDVKPVLGFSRGRLLIIRACAVGDFVLNLPTLRALAASSPGARFTLVGYPETLELARMFIPVEVIHSIETPPWSSLFAGPLDSRIVSTFEAAYVWMKDETVAANLRRSGLHRVVHAAPFPVNFLASGPPRPCHAAEHLLRTLQLPPPELPDLWTPSSGQVIIHPGSGSALKCWPHFSALIESLTDAAVLLGPCEAGFKTTKPCLRGLTLGEVVENLRRCRFFVGNDSGITHLAGYLGIPTLALFGPTDFRIWGPLGRRVQILWKPALEDISLEEVRNFL